MDLCRMYFDCLNPEYGPLRWVITILLGCCRPILRACLYDIADDAARQPTQQSTHQRSGCVAKDQSAGQHAGRSPDTGAKGCFRMRLDLFLNRSATDGTAGYQEHTQQQRDPLPERNCHMHHLLLRPRMCAFSPCHPTISFESASTILTCGRLPSLVPAGTPRSVARFIRRQRPTGPWRKIPVEVGYVVPDCCGSRDCDIVLLQGARPLDPLDAMWRLPRRSGPGEGDCAHRQVSRKKESGEDETIVGSCGCGGGAWGSRNLRGLRGGRVRGGFSDQKGGPRSDKWGAWCRRGSPERGLLRHSGGRTIVWPDSRSVGGIELGDCANTYRSVRDRDLPVPNSRELSSDLPAPVSVRCRKDGCSRLRTSHPMS